MPAPTQRLVLQGKMAPEVASQLLNLQAETVAATELARPEPEPEQVEPEVSRWLEDLLQR